MGVSQVINGANAADPKPPVVREYLSDHSLSIAESVPRALIDPESGCSSISAARQGRSIVETLESADTQPPS